MEELAGERAALAKELPNCRCFLYCDHFLEINFAFIFSQQHFYRFAGEPNRMEVNIVDYAPQYRADFAALNLAWIAEHFVVEPHDLEQLEDPEGDILAKGGQIYFVKVGEEVAGTVALVKVGETSYEMAKMAVKPVFKGLGIGERLGRHLIAAAQAKGATYLYLESNQKLVPALTLYKKLGFVEVPIGPTPYARANYKAEMYF
jgi:putative acetyltransferase